MRGEAYLYAEGLAPPSFELTLLSYIDRFGVEPVIGRPHLSYGEIQRMLTAENVVDAFRSMKKATNWASWATEFPEKAKLLERSEHASRS